MNALIADQVMRMRAVAAEIREHPETWCQGTLGRLADGTELWDEREDIEIIHEGKAVKFCALGFCRRDSIDPGPLRKYLRERGITRGIEDWNDTKGRKPEEVAQAFEDTAAGLEAPLP